MARDINKAGFDLIKSYESCRLRAYDDKQPKVRLKATTKIKGTLTVGWGHTGSLAAIGRPGSVAWNTEVTQAEADKLFRADLDEAEGHVEGFITVPLNGNEFSALVSFTFNCGLGGLRKLAGARLNRDNDRLATAEAFKLFNKSKGEVMKGLVRRRAEEAVLFLKPVGAEARATGTQTPDDVKASLSPGQKAQAAAAGGGVAVGAGASLWDSAVGALKETSDWTWGLPETLGTAVIVGAVGVAVWLWWRRRRAAKAA